MSKSNRIKDQRVMKGVLKEVADMQVIWFAFQTAKENLITTQKKLVTTESNRIVWKTIALVGIPLSILGGVAIGVFIKSMGWVG